ncbi:DciA family protein [Streptomyces abikoensis]|uniref:DciA family protein n=1 Tax=Streptomyces abikoensis TaxID=97398 RepID=UPI0036ABFCD4
MTEQTTTNQTGSGDGAPKLSGLDLARVALQQARLAAKNNGGGQARAPRRLRPAAVKRDGREPSGFAAVLAGLMADRAWELPATGGSILDRWTDIAATIAPQLPHYVAAVAFHPETGQLDLRPDSPAYGTQLRLLNARIIAAANDAAGTQAVRSIRVLAAGATLAPRTTQPAPAAAVMPEAPAKTKETASPGYHRALSAHQAAMKPPTIDPAIREAAERQVKDRLREPEELFGNGHQTLDGLRAKAARERAADGARARALRRARAERAGLPLPQPLRRTA